MLIKVNDIIPNPYRRLDKYPIIKEKVQQLSNSIKETGFWDNVVVRKSKLQTGKYELAYGHHRLEAIKQNGITKIDIPIKDISDANMLKMMASENINDWVVNSRVISETVRAIYDFLTSELSKVNSLNDCTGTPLEKIISGNKQIFSKVKNNGITATHIWKFIGSSYKKGPVFDAFSLISNEDILNVEAIETFTVPRHASIAMFRLKRAKISKKRQAAIITEVRARLFKGAIKKGKVPKNINFDEIESDYGLFSRDNVEKIFDDVLFEENLGFSKPSRKNPMIDKRNADSTIRGHCETLQKISIDMEELFKIWKNIDYDVRAKYRNELVAFMRINLKFFEESDMKEEDNNHFTKNLILLEAVK